MMKSIYSVCICCLALLFFPVTLPAADQDEEDIKAFEKMFPPDKPSEEDFYRADELLISATGSLKPVRLAPSVATVITAEDIKKMGATTLDEVLETIPGLHVTPSGVVYLNSIWSIRGYHSTSNPHALLLLNSVPFVQAHLGSRPYSYKMPVSMISRVEVVRGPGSALHGADAFSGTINVITKDNHEIDGSRISLQGGSFDTYDVWLQHGQAYGDWEVAASLEWQQSESDDGRIVDKDFGHYGNPGIPANPSQSLAPGSLDTSYELFDSHVKVRRGGFDFNLYGSLQNSSPGISSVQALTNKSEIKNKLLLTDLTYKNNDLFVNWDLSSRLYYSYIHTDYYFQQLPTGYLNMIGNPITLNQDVGLELSGVYSGFKRHNVRLGAGWKNYDEETDQYKNFGPAAGAPANWFGEPVHVTDQNHIFMDDANRQLWYALIQDEWWIFPRWTLTAGLRHDEYSDFGGTTNPRMALVWETRYDLTVKLMYGRAFRAPSFNEQYVKNNPQVIGNEDLGPEKTEVTELAFDYQPTRDLRFLLSFFHYESTDLIESSGPLPQELINIGEQEGQGFELAMDWLIQPEFRLRGNLAYQRSINKETDAVVPEAPEWQFYLNPNWEFMPDWSLGGQYFYIGGRHRAQGDSRDDIDDYDIVNFTLRRENIKKNWEVALAARNLFDEDGRTPSPYSPGSPDGSYIPNDFPIAGRSIWIELTYHFK